MKRTWKATIILSIAIIGLFTWGDLYLESIGLTSQAQALFVGVIIGGFLIGAWVAPKNKQNQTPKKKDNS